MCNKKAQFKTHMPTQPCVGSSKPKCSSFSELVPGKFSRLPYFRIKAMVSGRIFRLKPIGRPEDISFDSH